MAALGHIHDRPLFHIQFRMRVFPNDVLGDVRALAVGVHEGIVCLGRDICILVCAAILEADVQILSVVANMAEIAGLYALEVWNISH